MMQHVDVFKGRSEEHREMMFIKHTGIMSSLDSELEVVVGCESIKGKYYVSLFWFNSFFMYLLWLL